MCWGYMKIPCEDKGSLHKGRIISYVDVSKYQKINI